MLVVRAAWPLAMLAISVLWPHSQAASASVKLCGRKLGDIMSRVCKVYNSPSWDVPTVVEQPQPVSLVRRRRSPGGIADECCTHGCTYEQLSEYCSVSDNADLMEGLETHLIEDRSAESGAGVSSPAVVAVSTTAVRREVGRGTRGYGRRRRRCRCRRMRIGRPRRRPGALMGNMGMIKSVTRAAPVVGTVSPLLTWGRTINTDLPQVERDRYAYVAVYNI